MLDSTDATCLWQLSPTLALLLVHDLLLSKRGISASASHPLRSAVARHKARLSAEFTKARLRRGFPTIGALKSFIEKHSNPFDAGGRTETNPKTDKALPLPRLKHPRWVRVNTVKTSLQEQLSTTFAGYTVVESVEKLLCAAGSDKMIYIDDNVPDLVAVPPNSPLASIDAYKNGHLIFQDKASCFTAYLLGPPVSGKDCLDACAAPGNKTTHMAAILQSDLHYGSRRATVFACDRSRERAAMLQYMTSLAGVDNMVKIRPGQDFLRLDPEQSPWNDIGSILLDPSCSGSGIIGRDDAPEITLPPGRNDKVSQVGSRKRRRVTKEIGPKITSVTENVDVSLDEASSGQERIVALSTFQLKVIIHAFRFPSASKIVYSTCSVHAEENEHVVMKALQSLEAMEGTWRIMEADQQPFGLQSWPIRGDLSACLEPLSGSTNAEVTGLAKKVAKACIRCEKGTIEGTQGFFVAGFVRSKKDAYILPYGTGTNNSGNRVAQSKTFGSESDWEGLDSP